MNSPHIVQIGLGVVGLAYVKAYLSKKFKVSGIEYCKAIIEKYKHAFDIYHVDDDMNKLKDVDFILISVNTPLKGEELDMSFLFSTIRNVAVIIKNNPEAYVILRSTVPPLTTNKYKLQLEKEVGFKVKCGFNPEFLRAVSAYEDALHPWYVVLSVLDNVDTKPLVDLYSNFIDISKIRIVNIEEAEIMKIFHNSFNANKISFFNQCYLLCEQLNEKHNTNIDMNIISEIMTHTCEGLINRKYGTKVGHHYDGECLIKDAEELASLEKKYALNSTLFKSVDDVNKDMIKQDNVKHIPIKTEGDFHMSFVNMNHDPIL